MPPSIAGLDLPHPPPWIIGHRGAGGEAPENTLESFELAVAQGADMVELDLQLTRDGHLVAFHDWELDRLTGHPGEVERLTRDALAEIPVRRHPAGGDVALPIPDLDEVLETLPDELPLNLEIKRRTAAPDAVADALSKSLDGRGRVLVSSFDWPLLAELRARLPTLPIAPIGRTSRNDLVTCAETLEAASVHCGRRRVRRALVERASAAGRPTLVYTVNRAAEARRLLARGVAGVFTDFPGRLRRELGGGA